MTKDEKLEEIVADTFTELHRSEVAIANAINTNPKMVNPAKGQLVLLMFIIYC